MFAVVFSEPWELLGESVIVEGDYPDEDTNFPLVAPVLKSRAGASGIKVGDMVSLTLRYKGPLDPEARRHVNVAVRTNASASSWQMIAIGQLGRMRP